MVPHTHTQAPEHPCPLPPAPRKSPTIQEVTFWRSSRPCPCSRTCARRTLSETPTWARSRVRMVGRPSWASWKSGASMTEAARESASCPLVARNIWTCRPGCHEVPRPGRWHRACWGPGLGPLWFSRCCRWLVCHGRVIQGLGVVVCRAMVGPWVWGDGEVCRVQGAVTWRGWHGLRDGSDV